MLHQQLGHHQPARFGGGIGIVCAVNLEDLASRHHEFGFCRVHKRAIHVDVAVKHVVLGILVSAVNAFLNKQHGHFRTGDTRNIAVEINRPADFFLNQIAGFTAGTQLLAGDRHAADALRCAFHQAVDMTLTGRTDHHQMIRAVPGSHAHPPQVILKPP